MEPNIFIAIKNYTNSLNDNQKIHFFQSLAQLSNQHAQIIHDKLSTQNLERIYSNENSPNECITNNS